MRRLLLAAAVLVPLAVVAAITTPPPGKVVEVDNYNANATTPTSYINAAQCAPGGLLNLKWSITGGGTSSSSHRIIASSAPPPTSGDAGVANYCPEADPDASPPVLSNQVASVPWTSNIQATQISGKLVADTAGVACDATGEGDVVYVCAHLLADDGKTKLGYASGLFQVQFAAPGAPVITAASAAGEDRVAVEWTRGPGDVQVDHYRAVAMDAAGAEVGWATTEGTSATISGLTLGTTYIIVVYAYSLGGNQSDASAPRMATPAPVLDFWEAYKTAGGTDDGGCASGGAGPLALLGVGSLLLLRRRR